MQEPSVKGIIPPLVTPLTGKHQLDRRGFERLIEHVVDGGVQGVFILGSTGEFATLTDKQRGEIIDLASQMVAGRVPLFVNVTSSSYLQTLEHVRFAGESKSDYLVLAPPFYYPMNQEEIRSYFERVADRCAVPLILYNAPQYCHNELEPSTVKMLAGHGNIAGIKDSSGDRNYVAQLLAEREEPDFSILIGPEKMLGELIVQGCNGGVNGGGNLFPKLYVKMYRAAMQRDPAEMNRCQQWIERVSGQLYEVPDSPLGIVIALKYALSVRGICSGTMAAPVYNSLTESQKNKIKAFLDEMEHESF